MLRANGWPVAVRAADTGMVVRRLAVGRVLTHYVERTVQVEHGVTHLQSWGGESGGSEVQGHPQHLSKFEASLCYTRSSQKQPTATKKDGEGVLIHIIKPKGERHWIQSQVQQRQMEVCSECAGKRKGYITSKTLVSDGEQGTLLMVKSGEETCTDLQAWGFWVNWLDGILCLNSRQ